MAESILENGSRISLTVLVSTLGLMVRATKEPIDIIVNMATEPCVGQMEEIIRAHGQKEDRMDMEFSQILKD